MGPTKFIWDPHDLVGPMWILTNQRKCVGKCVLECVLLAFLIVREKKRNASNTHSNTHFSTHSLWLVKIHMGPTKFIWDPPNIWVFVVLVVDAAFIVGSKITISFNVKINNQCGYSIHYIDDNFLTSVLECQQVVKFIKLIFTRISWFQLN